MTGRIYRPEQAAEDILEFPEIGRLHIGMKNERGLPQSIDWFRATGKYAGLFHKALGDKPQTIQIIFPSDNPERVCNERYEYRDDKGALVAKGDGKTFKVWDGKRYVELSAADHPNLMQSVMSRYPSKRVEWDVVLTIRAIVPAVRGVVGVWQFSTKGKASSINNIRESFDAVQTMRGTVTSTVFDLSVEFAKSNKPGSSSRYPVVSLVANDQRIDEIRQLLQGEQVTKNLLLGKE